MSNKNLFLKSGFPRAPFGLGIGRYVCQLQRITLKFCKNRGASRGIRGFIEHDLVNYAKENPGVVVYVKPRRHRQPVIVAEYRRFFYLWNTGCGQSLATNVLKHLMDQFEERILQTDQLKTLERLQHCVDLNGDSQWMEVANYSREDVVKWMELLRTQFHNGPSLRLRKLWHTEFPSIQGPWTPFTFRNPMLNLVQFPNKEIGAAVKLGPTATEQLVELFKAQQLANNAVNDSYQNVEETSIHVQRT